MASFWKLFDKMGNIAGYMELSRGRNAAKRARKRVAKANPTLKLGRRKTI